MARGGEGRSADAAARAALLEADAELAAVLGEEDRAAATRTLVARRLTLDPGSWTARSDAFALLIERGLVVRETSVGGRMLPQVLGGGDVIEPWVEPDGPLGGEVRTLVATRATVLVLDERFVAAAARWPALMVEVNRRLAAQAQRLAVQGAICQLPRVEVRLLATLWHLAERWGRVGHEGVVLPVKLTHETLGRFVGARRPSVTLAVRDLTGANLVARRDDGGWLLPLGSQEVLTELLGAPREGPADWSLALRLRPAPPDRAPARP